MIEDDGFITIHPDVSAPTTQEQDTDAAALVSARAVLADLPHHADAALKSAAETILEHSSDDYERREASLLIALLSRTKPTT